MIRVFVKKDEVYSKPIEYILSVLSKNKSFTITFAEDKNGCQLIFDPADPASVPINTSFYESLLTKGIYNYREYFSEGTFILFPGRNEPDYLATAFYMINAFQEYDADPGNFDEFGRFRFERSYQHEFDCIETNIVRECFDQFCKRTPALSALVSKEVKTRVFVSHDIDTIYGSFLQDGLWALKRGRIDVILKLIFNELLMSPGWKNMDKIVKMDSAYDVKSTFFWIATKKVASNKVKNADYSIQKLDKTLRLTGINGLHKSCANLSFGEELDLLPFRTGLNRYHFLKFNIPAIWKELETTSLKLDASLGFAERYGFRNSFGMPFRPYNLKTGTSYDFIEVPLNIMDGALHRYMKIPLEQTSDHIIGFFEKNKTNCILSFLWHNTYFTDYKYSGYCEAYKKVLVYLHESGIQSITPEEIINQF